MVHCLLGCRMPYLHRLPHLQLEGDLPEKEVNHRYLSHFIRTLKFMMLLLYHPHNPGPPKKKQKDDVISCTGTVIESLPNAMFRVEIEGASGQVVLATISGKIRKNFVRIVVGDSVMVDLSAYDLTRGRITYRNK